MKQNKAKGISVGGNNPCSAGEESVQLDEVLKLVLLALLAIITGQHKSMVLQHILACTAQCPLIQPLSRNPKVGKVLKADLRNLDFGC